MKTLALSLVFIGAALGSVITEPIPMTGSGSWSTTWLLSGFVSINLSGSNGTDSLLMSLTGNQNYHMPPTDFFVFGPGSAVLNGITYQSGNVDIGNGTGEANVVGSSRPINIPLVGYIQVTSFEHHIGETPQEEFWRGTFNVTATPTPEPAGWLLAGFGVSLILFRRRIG